MNWSNMEKSRRRKKSKKTLLGKRCLTNPTEKRFVQCPFILLPSSGLIVTSIIYCFISNRSKTTPHCCTRPFISVLSKRRNRNESGRNANRRKKKISKVDRRNVKQIWRKSPMRRKSINSRRRPNVDESFPVTSEFDILFDKKFDFLFQCKYEFGEDLKSVESTLVQFTTVFVDQAEQNIIICHKKIWIKIFYILKSTIYVGNFSISKYFAIFLVRMANQMNIEHCIDERILMQTDQTICLIRSDNTITTACTSMCVTFIVIVACTSMWNVTHNRSHCIWIQFKTNLAGVKQMSFDAKKLFVIEIRVFPYRLGV